MRQNSSRESATGCYLLNNNGDNIMKVSKTTSKQAQAQQLIYDIFTNNGVVGVETEDRDRLNLECSFKDVFNIDKSFESEGLGEFKDVFYTEDLTRYIGTTVTRLVEEAIEPDLLVVPNLFQEISYEGPGRTVEIGSIGAIHAEEVPEGQEYPEPDFDYGDGYIIQLGINKHGLKMRVTEEVISDNLFDVFGLWMRMAGRALARHKEEYAIKLLAEMGYDVFDNSSPGTSANGVCTGRDITGTQNGAMTIHDIFDMWTFGYLRGFNYDTILMNPLAWKTFMNDPMSREIMFSGGVLASRSLPAGSTANTGFGVGAFGKLGYKSDPTGNDINNLGGKLAGPNPFTTDLNPLGNTYNIAPTYLPSPMKVIVSPHVPYSTAQKKDEAGAIKVTDVYMADSANCGLLMTKEGVSMDEWNDPERDIRAMKLKERWGMALLAQGKGVACARDVVLADHYVFDNVNNAQITVGDGTNLVDPPA